MRSGRCPLEATLLPSSLLTTANRTVKENSPPGTNVGKPLTAGDAGDILTYTMAGIELGWVTTFTIHPATGQIMVGTPDRC